MKAGIRKISNEIDKRLNKELSISQESKNKKEQINKIRYYSKIINKNKNMKKLTILVGCEESQSITKAFRDLGHEAYSCDLLPCSGGHPEWHYQQDIFEVVGLKKWDMAMFHPPCTFLSVSGAKWMYHPDDSDLPYDQRRPHPKFPNRRQDQKEGLDFVRALMSVDIDHAAIENPISVISSQIRKPDQIIQPWQFGDEAMKTTCLWTKNLPQLKHTNIVGKGEKVIYSSGKSHAKWYADALSNAKTDAERRTLRSKTFPGIAKAIAEQWSEYLLSIGKGL